MFKVLLLKLPLVGGALGLGSLGVYFNFRQENPVIKKNKQFILWGPEYDVILGKYASEYHRSSLVKSNSIMEENTEEHKLVVSASRLIIDSLEHYVERPWNIQVVKDKAVNAYVFPDGSIFVNTGLLKQLRSPDELIFILSHEISHAELRHSANQICTSITARIAIFLVLGYFIPDLADVFTSWISDFIVSLPMSRNCEAEADLYGLKITKYLGYNPLRSIEFFEYLKKLGGTNIEYLSTHPTNDHRIENIRAENEKISNEFSKVNKDIEMRALLVTNQINKYIKNKK